MLLRWTCNAAATQSSPLCNLYALNSSFSVYLPASSIVVDGGVSGVSLFVAVVLLFQLELFLESLSFMSTYPLDFQKLRWQRLRAEGGSARAAEPSNEQLLLQALLIGQDTTAAAGSVSLDPLSHGSSNYSENTALSEAQVQQARQARLVDSVVSVGMQPPVVPYFGEGASLVPVTPVHRKFPTNVAHLSNASHNEDHLANIVSAGVSAESREASKVGKFDLLALLGFARPPPAGAGRHRDGGAAPGSAVRQALAAAAGRHVWDDLCCGASGIIICMTHIL